MNDKNHAPAPTVRQPFQPDDIYLEQRITDLHLVRGQRIAVCAVSQPQRGSDDYRSVLWTFSLDGSDARQLTWGPGRDESPRWSPDGRRIAFLSDRAGGKPQIYLIQLDGGEAHAVTALPCGVEDLAWRPDGTRLLALCAVPVDPDRHAKGTAAPDPFAPQRAAGAPEVVWRLPYKLDGEGYTQAQRRHLFLIDPDTGAATAVTRGDLDVRGFGWAPDGRQITFAATRTDPRAAHCTDLWSVPVDDTGATAAPRRLSHAQANVSAPSWSPDGRWIAFSGSLEAGDAQNSLWLCDPAAGTVQQLGSPDLEAVAGNLHWQPDSQGLWFVQAHRGIQRAACIAVPGGQVQPIDPGLRHVALLAVNECLAYTLEGPAQPLELHSAALDGGKPRQLSHFNAWWDERQLPRVAYRAFEVPDGSGGRETIDGWLLRPAQSDGPCPLLVLVHGGPASYARVEFPAEAYRHLLCSRGWAVLALNPVGSSSYGRAFAGRLRERWGELDLPQHLAAIRALQDEGIADERVAIAGSSYGGYLSAWAIGDCDLFRAAVVCAPVGNLETHFGTSDSGFYADPYSMNGTPQQDRALMLRLSPMKHIEQACTPTLFLQGKEDERCPKCQSEELFVKLRTAGDTPAEMVLYPGGSHHVFGQGKPTHRVDILRRVLGWLTRWIDQPLPSRADMTDRRDETAGAAPSPAPQAPG